MPSKITKITTMRLKNEDIDAIDAMAEMLGKSRSDTIRILITPAVIQAKTAMETKSVLKASKARLNAEVEQSRLIHSLARASEVQEKLNLDVFADEEYRLATA